jgi:hypothetical protein
MKYKATPSQSAETQQSSSHDFFTALYDTKPVVRHQLGRGISKERAAELGIVRTEDSEAED